MQQFGKRALPRDFGLKAAIRQNFMNAYCAAKADVRTQTQEKLCAQLANWLNAVIRT